MFSSAAQHLVAVSLSRVFFFFLTNKLTELSTNTFVKVVAALRDFAHTHTHQKLRAVIANYSLDLEACPSATSALVDTTWGIGWHPRVLQETFVFCAGSNAAPAQDFLAAFMVVLAEEHDIDVVGLRPRIFS